MTETSAPYENRLLRALPADVRERLLRHAQPVSLPRGQILFEAGATLHDVYFPTGMIVSLMYTMASGASAAIAVVGNEGVVGIALFMGGDSTPSRAVVQCAGTAYVLPGHHLRAEFDRHGALQDLLLRYTQSLIMQMAQTALCNRHHAIEQQLCRWLLLSLDRQRGDRLAMTQSAIADVLGVRREGVTEAAGKLQRLGLIAYSRGRIMILDRPGIERLSCECYAAVKAETDRLLR